MNHNTEDYYEWRKQAEKEGLVHKAALQYYIEDSKQLYAVYINGNPVPVPIFSYRDWVDVQEIEYPIHSYDSEKISDFDRANLQSLVEIIQYRESGEESGDVEVEDYMWNADVYGVTNCSRQGINFDFVKSDYFTVRERGAQLEEELYTGLYDSGFDPDASVLDLAGHLNETSTPYRDKVAPDFETVLKFKNQPRMAGGNAVTIFNTGDTYKVPIIKRSENVSESAGWWTPVPAGVFQPYSNSVSEPSLKDHLLKEYAEHFFGIDPRDPIPDNLDGINELEEQLTSDEHPSKLVFTSAGIDCKNTNIQLYGALVIDDPDYFEKHIKGEMESTWEASDYRFIDVKDEESLKDLMKPVRVTNPYNVMGLTEALLFLRQEYNTPLGVDLDRI